MIRILLLIALGVNWTLQSSLVKADCSQLINRPWRGLNCFHCLHPRATDGHQPIVKLLKDSCLKKVIITFVIDGSFGWSEERIISAINALSSESREVWLHLYVYNGPAQRRWQSGFFNSFAIMDPAIFRSRMKSDPELQLEYKAIIRERILPIVKYARTRGVRVSIAPGLEDNLDDQGFRIALKILKSVIPRKLNIQYIRSVCYQCQTGNGRQLPDHVLYEEHSDQYFRRVKGGIINTDGRYFRFQDETGSFPTLQDWITLLRDARRAKNAFILWVGHFQDAPAKVVPKSPDSRNYRGPSEREAREIIEFLQSS